MALETDLVPALAADGQRVEFRQLDGPPLLAYDSLKVYDANGRRVRSHFELESPTASAQPRLSIVVHDSNATYPLDVDPELRVEFVKDINVANQGCA
jgi:hypothetical protein